MILGIVGLTMIPLIASIIAIVLGKQARERIAQDPSLDGEGFATAGVIMGWVGVVLAVGGLLLFWTVAMRVVGWTAMGFVIFGPL